MTHSEHHRNGGVSTSCRPGALLGNSASACAGEPEMAVTAAAQSTLLPALAAASAACTAAQASAGAVPAPPSDTLDGPSDGQVGDVKPSAARSPAATTAAQQGEEARYAVAHQATDKHAQATVEVTQEEAPVAHQATAEETQADCQATPEEAPARGPKDVSGPLTQRTPLAAMRVFANPMFASTQHKLAGTMR